MADVGLVLEDDAEETDIIEDGCGDGHDEQKDTGSKEEEDSEPERTVSTSNDLVRSYAIHQWTIIRLLTAFK